VNEENCDASVKTFGYLSNTTQLYFVTKVVELHASFSDMTLRWGKIGA